MNVEEVLLKYKTVGRVVRSKRVPLDVKLATVVYKEESLGTGVEAVESLAYATYSIAYAVYTDEQKALEAISIAINKAKADFDALNQHLV